MTSTILFLLIIPFVIGQLPHGCRVVCPDEYGNMPIAISGGVTESNSTGIGLMTMIIAMSILAGWWIKAAIVRTMEKKKSRRKPRRSAPY